MVKFQLRHGNDLLAMDSIRDCDVSKVEDSSLEFAIRVLKPEFVNWVNCGQD